MNPDFLTELSQWPTGLFTVLMGLVVLYWIFFLIGSLDLDLLGGADGVDGVDGLGGVDSAGHVVDGGGASHGAHGGDLDGAGGGADAVGLIHALRLRSVPLTISVSFIVFFSWVLSYIGMRLLTPLLPALVVKIGVFVIAGVGGIALTSVAVRPFAKLFRDQGGATRQAHLVGRVVTVTTGRVDARFGQATCDTGAANFILEVRARPDSAGAKLVRGDHALIIDYNDETRVFYVEPADPILVELRGQ